MSPRKTILLMVLSIILPTLMPAFAPAQGILRRLRDRIAAPPAPVPTAPRPGTTLPNRTVPSQVPRTPSQGAAPTARYQLPSRQSSSRAPVAPSEGASARASTGAQLQRQPAASSGRTLATPGYGNANPYRPPSRVSPSITTRIPTTARPGIVTPIPTMPTPAARPSGAAPSGVAQTSASRPNQTTPSSEENGSYGRSILKPLDFDADPVPSKQRLPQSPERNSTSQTTIGVQAVGANPGYPGVRVRAFRPHSLADDAGLRVGDYIFGIDGVPTPSIEALSQQVRRRQPGDSVTLRVGRDGRVSDLAIQLVARPGTSTSFSPAPSTRQSAGPTNPRTSAGPKIGADVRDVDGTRGVVVTNVEAGSLAQRAGLKRGDRIIAVDGRMIATTSDLLTEISGLSNDVPFEVRLVRDGKLVQATVPVGSSVASVNMTPADSPTPAANPSAKALADQSSAKPSGSLLGGLGSVFGGVFGGAKQPTSPPNEQSTAASIPAASISETVESSVEELLPPSLELERDPLALEPVASEMPTPAGEVPASDQAELKTEMLKTKMLKTEIQRLKAQLQKLEAQVSE